MDLFKFLTDRDPEKSDGKSGGDDLSKYGATIGGVTAGMLFLIIIAPVLSRRILRKRQDHRVMSI